MIQLLILLPCEYSQNLKLACQVASETQLRTFPIDELDSHHPLSLDPNHILLPGRYLFQEVTQIRRHVQPEIIKSSSDLQFLRRRFKYLESQLIFKLHRNILCKSNLFQERQIFARHIIDKIFLIQPSGNSIQAYQQYSSKSS